MAQPKRSTWSDTIFFDPLKCGKIERWLDDNKPSKTISSRVIGKSKRFAVVHPSMSVSEFKRTRSRKGQTSEKTIAHVKKTIASITHSEIVKLALKEIVLGGFWMLFCITEEEWDSTWYKLVKTFYKFNKDNDPKFAMIETSEFLTNYIINIYVEDITDLDNIKRVAETLNIASKKLSRYLKRSFPSIYFKPTIFSDCGLRSSNYRLTAYIFKHLIQHEIPSDEPNFDWKTSTCEGEVYKIISQFRLKRRIN